jgi:ribosome-associated protein
MIPVTRTLLLDENELEFRFIRAAGPGGQNVNKVASAVQLRFDIGRSRSLPPEVRARLLHSADRRVSSDGVLVITAQRFRTQTRNRADAVARLITLVRGAMRPVKVRLATRPSRASRERRLEYKRQRGNLKRQRGARDAGNPEKE